MKLTKISLNYNHQLRSTDYRKESVWLVTKWAWHIFGTNGENSHHAL